MSKLVSPERSLWVQHLSGLDGHGLWVVCQGNSDTLRAGVVGEWQAVAERSMALRAELASFSVVTPDVSGGGANRLLPVGVTVQAGTAALPLTFLSGRTADLIGITAADDESFCSPTRFTQWVEAATRKGLVHYWLAVDPLLLSEAGLRAAAYPVPRCEGDAVHFTAPEVAGQGCSGSGISVGIDAAWLAGPESGAQVVVVEMVRELASRSDIERIVLLSDTGHVPGGFHGIVKVSGLSWQAALAKGNPVVDIMHRPYQPGPDVDYRRYHRVARCVALTVLDFIAYDNPAYHESAWLWRQYQQAFDECVCLADCVFAISPYVGSRLEHQFAHRLSGPVRTVPLGTDHLKPHSDTGAAAPPGPMLRALEQTPFLLVLGNDFEHKNRDFAVKVFADLRDRGYNGHLVLAGFHLDGGSSFGHELSGAGPHLGRIARMGSVSAVDKTWLLRHAQAVLYPTSSEGFGLVPFEAAALGTPTAFVSFGPLRETLPGVDACTGWAVRAFADEVLRLIANPDTQVEQIRVAGAALTWAAHVDPVLEGYRHLLSAGAQWRTRAMVVPGPGARLQRATDVLANRAKNKLRRLIGKSS